MSVQNNPFREVKLTVYPGEGGTPIILAIRVCAAGEGRYGFQAIWSGKGSRLTGSLTKY